SRCLSLLFGSGLHHRPDPGRGRWHPRRQRLAARGMTRRGMSRSSGRERGQMRRILAGCFWVAFCLAHGAWGAGEQCVGHRVLGADQDRVAIVGERGEVEWEVSDPCEVHDIALLPNGNLLFPTGRTTVVEMTRAKQVVWQHVSKPKAGYDGPVEIHGFQR